MKNICLTIWNIHNCGGTERMGILLANELAANGYNISVASVESHSGKSFFPLSENIKVVHLGGARVKERLTRFFCHTDYPTYAYRKFLKEHNIELVIDVDTTNTYRTSECIKGLGIKLISWDHFYFGLFKKYCEQYPLEKLLSNVPDKMVVLTKQDKLKYTQETTISEDKICQIYNPSPIEMDCYTPHRSKRVLALGRLVEVKGYDRLLKAWAIIEQNMKDWELELVGDGPLKDSLIQLANDLGLKNVIFSPSTKSPIEKYRHASVFVLTSHFEGLPLVLLEAANMSLPMVSFDCDHGPREIIQDGINGFLVPEGDIEEFAAKLQNVMIDDSLRDNLSHNCLASVKNFRKEVIIQQWLDLIDNL